MRRVLLITGTILALVTALGASLAGAFFGSPPFTPSTQYRDNFPDPAIVVDGNRFVAYSTATGGVNLPIMTSTDLKTWIARSNFTGSDNDGLQKLPGWAAPSADVWAPAVAFVNGQWLAYYSVRDSAVGRRMCITVATSASPVGPFRDDSSGPIQCNRTTNSTGSIDPFVYRDRNGSQWLLWKDELFSVTPGVTFPTSIWVRRLAADGRSFAPGSSPQILLTGTSRSDPTWGWEDSNVENPAMFDVNGQIFLMYSANHWDTRNYATGWARCDSPQGPCTDVSVEPILKADEARWGPGGASVFLAPNGQLHVAYHAWNPPYHSYPSCPFGQVCDDQGQRFLWIEPLCVIGGSSLHMGVPSGWKFCDVAPSTFYFNAVSWMANSSITQGLNETAFGPENTLNRGQLATFLWRMAGQPTTTARSPFSDVTKSAYYYTAVTWLQSTGVINGTTPTTFDPAGPITRGQMAALLHRFVGQPRATAAAGFTDVAPGAFFAKAVDWLAQNGVTSGITPTTFGPNQILTRGQAAAFMCRLTRTTAGWGPGAVVNPVNLTFCAA